MVPEFGITLLFGMWGAGVGRGSASFTCIKLKFPLFQELEEKAQESDEKHSLERQFVYSLKFP